MDRDKFIICMVSVLSLGIGGDCRSTEAQHSQNNNGSASYEAVWSSKLPSQSTCGRNNASHYNTTLYDRMYNVHNRIVGGKPAELGAWPWMAAIGYQNLIVPTTDYEWLGSGILISDIYVLTAAHCTVGNTDQKLAVVRLGDLNLDPEVNDGAEPINVAVSQIMTHEKYVLATNDTENYENDIALLKLEKSVGFNQFIQPICLPILPNLRDQTFVGAKPIVAGWGSKSLLGPDSKILMEVKVPVIDNPECKRLYAKKNITIYDQYLCAGKTEKDACVDDSGGPLMWHNGNQYYLIGIVSFGVGCGAPGFPGVYVRVTSFMEWMANKINTY